MKYKLAIFDMDGTILNTIEDLTDTMNYALGQFAMPLHTIEEVKSYVGNGIHRLVERAVPEGTSEERIDEVYECFRDYYKDHCAIKTRPYEGICDSIRELRSSGIKTAVVSNKADFAVKSLCDDYFPGLFDYSLGDRDGMRIKPYPDGVEQVLDYFKTDKKDAVYIGDSEVDYQTALNAGLSVIMVSWGFREIEFIRSLGAKTIANAAKELEGLII